MDSSASLNSHASRKRLHRTTAPRLTLVTTAAWLIAGCAAPPASQIKRPEAAVHTGAPLNRPAGVSQTMEVVAAVLPLGHVPYDNMALPLISPDGRFVAVQTGAAPTWATVLAEPDAQGPFATRIEIYELDRREDVKPPDRRQPALAATLLEPVVLGRSVDQEGFLIESVRPDGSRWIGKAHWNRESGEIDWLVQGSEINAFASLGPAGRLAWSRRALDGERFELVVRLGRGASDEQDWSLSSSTGDWFMPTWSARGDNIFAMFLEDGRLDARYLMASSVAAAHQSMQRLSLATECDAHTAYQSLIGQSSVTLSHSEQLVFFHPALRRVAVWRPLAMSDRQRIQLNAGSITALVDQEDMAFVATRDHLVRQHLRHPQERLNLVAGLQIPRQTTSGDWPYVLLSPGEGHVGLTAMRLLPREDSIFLAPRSK